MEKELETRPDQSLCEATAQWFEKSQNANPIPGVLCIVVLVALLLVIALYVGRDNPNKIGPTMGVEILMVIAAICLSKKRCMKLIGSSKTLQQRYLREKILRKATH